MSFRLLWLSVALAAIFLYAMAPLSLDTEGSALVAFVEEDYSRSERLLKEAHSQLSDSRYFLNKAYLYMANGRLNIAKLQLERAMSSAKKADLALVREILLSRALQAYLSGDDEGLKEIMQTQGKSFVAGDGWWFFFEGIAAFQGADYERAYGLWKVKGKFVSLSPWMEETFKRYFSLEKREAYFLRAAIFSGQIDEAKVHLERIQKSLSKDESLLLATLIDVKNGEALPSKMASSHYESAFNIVGLLKEKRNFAGDFEWISKSALKHLSYLLEQNEWDQVPVYLQLLEIAGSKKEQDSVVKLLFKHIGEGLVESLKGSEGIDGLRDALVTVLNVEVDTALSRKQFRIASQWADFAYALTHSPEVIANRFAESTKSLLAQKYEFAEIASSLALWKRYEINPISHIEMSFRLLKVAEIKLKCGHGEQARELIELAMAVPAELYREVVLSEVSDLLTTTYRYATLYNLYGLLSEISLIQGRWALPLPLCSSDKELNSLTQDGEYLYDSGKYSDAAQVISWVLIQKPDHQRAIKLKNMINQKIGASR